MPSVRASRWGTVDAVHDFTARAGPGPRQGHLGCGGHIPANAAIRLRDVKGTLRVEAAY
jgi:hypothetical protein